MTLRHQGSGLLALLCALLSSTLVNAGFDNVSTPISFFYSRPDISPPAMNVSVQNMSAVEPGYVFIGPYQELQAGPYIFDKSGNLVWSGFGSAGPWNAHNVHPCQYEGSTHICMFQGNQQPGYARGHGVILDTNYNIVKTIGSGAAGVPADQHELLTLNNGETALMTMYGQKQWDLTKVDIMSSQGWILNTAFQEVNMTDGSVIFSWSPLDHVDPFTGYVQPESSDIAGDGLGPMSAWDFFHLNSVDKSKLTSNYLISARHMSTIYSINSTDGSIVWNLQAGGNSNFTCTNFNFSFQHDARIRSENETHMVISFFDNASNNYNKTSTASGGKTVVLDYTAKTATLMAPITRAPGNLLSASQGNMQWLENGNAFHSWGSWPVYSEHNRTTGEIVWAASIGPWQGHVMSYRAFSGPWRSVPANTKPALWSFSKDGDSMVAFYVSWDGCTEIDHWNFYAANSMSDEFSNIGHQTKAGFETMYTSETHYRYAFAEAMDINGTSLRNSTIQKTWIPGAALASSCLDTHCPGFVD